MKNASEKFAKINESKQKCNNNNNKKYLKLSEIEGEFVMLRCLYNS